MGKDMATANPLLRICVGNNSDIITHTYAPGPIAKKNIKMINPTNSNKPCVIPSGTKVKTEPVNNNDRATIAAHIVTINFLSTLSAIKTAINVAKKLIAVITTPPTIDT